VKKTSRTPTFPWKPPWPREVACEIEARQSTSHGGDIADQWSKTIALRRESEKNGWKCFADKHSSCLLLSNRKDFNTIGSAWATRMTKVVLICRRQSRFCLRWLFPFQAKTSNTSMPEMSTFICGCRLESLYPSHPHLFCLDNGTCTLLLPQSSLMLQSRHSAID